MRSVAIQSSRPKLRQILENRSSLSVYLTNDSRRELHGIFVRHSRALLGCALPQCIWLHLRDLQAREF